MSKILLVFFSRSGYTRKVAVEIASVCDCDIEEIKEARRRDGIFGYLRSALEAIACKSDLPLLHARHSVTNYDLVILGTPIWFWNISSPMRTYAARHRKQFSNVAFFCTYGGSGQDKVLRDLAQVCGKPPLLSLALTDDEIDRNEHVARVADFVGLLKSRMSGD